MHLLAEDVLLLCTDDESGARTINRHRLDRALAIALILELRLRGALHLDLGDGKPRSERLRRVPAVPLPDEILTKAARTADGRRTVAAILRVDGRRLRKPMTRRLVQGGVLTSRRTLRGRRYPQVDAHHEYAVRLGLRQVLTRQRAPDQRETVLLTLVAGLQLAPEILPETPPDAAIDAARQLARECPVSLAWSSSQDHGARTTLSPLRDAFDALDWIGEIATAVAILP